MKNNEQDKKDEEDVKMEPRRDILAHRGSLSVRSRSRLLFIWQHIMTVTAVSISVTENVNEKLDLYY